MRRFLQFAWAILFASSVLAQGRGVVECACPDPVGFDPKAYWTLERIGKAKAFATPILTPDQLRRLTARYLPALPSVFTLQGSALKKLVAPLAPPSQLADVTIPPHSSVGKLLFTENNVDSYCTAQVIGDGSMIVTAAHCVRNERSGAFKHNFSFIAGYNERKGVFSYVRCVGTWSSFPSPTFPNYAVDYAFGTLQTPIIPALSMKEGLPATEWIAVGYPQTDSEHQQFVRGGSVGVGNNAVQMSNNTMEDGASGGGWIVNDPGLGQTLIGVNSFISGTMQGPLFDSAVGLLYEHMVSVGAGTDSCPSPN
jgi:V8-like Glu-specific endopeptidase